VTILNVVLICVFALWGLVTYETLEEQKKKPKIIYRTKTVVVKDGCFYNKKTGKVTAQLDVRRHSFLHCKLGVTGVQSTIHNVRR